MVFTWLTRLRLRTRAAFNREHDDELRRELQLHLQMLEDEYRERGLSPDAAHQAAHRDFGNATRHQEASHELFAIRWLEHLVNDIAYAGREMRRSVGFSVIAIGSLALAFGAVTSAFAVIDAFLLRGIAVPEPDRLVAISVSNSMAWRRWSYAHYQHWRASTEGLIDIAASMTVDRFTVSTLQDGRPDVGKIRVSLVSGNYFRVLATPLAAGAPFTSQDDQHPGGHAVAVISEAFWVRAFGGQPEVVGRSIHLNGLDYRIVGVTARGFTGEWIGQPTDVWVPLSMYRDMVRDGQDLLDDRWAAGARPLRLIGRLEPGLDDRQVEAQINVAYQRFATARAQVVGDAQLSQDRATHIDLIAANHGYSPERAQYFKPLMILATIVGMVLAVAFANFANLLLARSQVRQADYTVRLALGASRWRLVQQILTECAVLGVIAGLLGLVAARWGTTVILKQLASTVQPVQFDLHLNARVLALDAACVGLVVLVGLWPAIRAACSAMTVTLVQRASNFETRRRTRFSTGQVLMGGQLVLCTVLLIAAALFLRTVLNLRGQPLGFDRNVLLVSLAPGEAGYRSDGVLQLIERLEDRLAALPGIERVSATTASLLNQTTYWLEKSERLSVDAGPVGAGRWWTSSEVSPGFFRTIGMPLMIGRDFSDVDITADTGAVVINRTLASLLFGEASPIGQRIGTGRRGIDSVVIGVVDDVKQTSPRDQGLGVIYRPLRGGARRLVLAVRTSGGAADATAMVRYEIASVASDVPITSLQTIEDRLEESIAQERLIGMLSFALGVIAVVIACVGLHALLSFDVAQRTREMGVRLAMGATAADVVGIVLRDTFTLAAVALAIGIPIGVSATIPLTPQLFGIQPQDPTTLALVAALLLMATGVAALRPATTAASSDLVALLREG